MPILNIKPFNIKRNNLTVNSLFLECREQSGYSLTVLTAGSTKLELDFHNFALNLQLHFNYILRNVFKEPTYECMRTNTCTCNDSSYI